ncbi:DUF1460 domain-containing protein [Croceivirga sp. JEA036]|nr:DUF1460 domain-containing protein [Croceivirga sp. JEA036]
MKTRMKFSFILSLLYCLTLQSQRVYQPKDSILLSQKIAALPDYKSLTLEETILAIGKTYLETPYVEQTLEVAAGEPLVINQQGLDCTTFVENVLALAHTAQQDTINWEQFVSTLETIRYRNGIRDGYASRLHYFTEWIKDNQRKGLVKDITNELGGIPLEKSINFMGTHRDLYPHLKDIDANHQKILAAESQLAKEEICYLPQNKIRKAEAKLQTGDIVALATNIKGLDVTHTGILVKKPNGRIYLLHASSKQKKVVLSTVPLVDYLKSIKSNIGIIVARPV